MSASHSATCQKVLTVKLSPHDIKGVKPLNYFIWTKTE